LSPTLAISGIHNAMESEEHTSPPFESQVPKPMGGM
jgi:hypothetical protein